MTPPRETSAQDTTGRHIVDVLIEERAEHLLHSPLWPLLRSTVYPLLRYRAARTMADAVAPMSGIGAMTYVSRVLRLDLKVTGTEHIPRTGPFIVIANHPTGIADGIAVYDAMKTIRPDLTFFANRDAQRVCPRFTELLIPVEWVEEKRSRAKTRETLVRSRQAFEDGRPVVIFPSGRLAHMTLSGLKERPWLVTTINLMRRYNTPIVPLNIRGRNSLLYYFFHFVNAELRNMTLFNELLNKRHYRYDLMFGPAIQPEHVTGEPPDAIAALQAHVEHHVRKGRAFTSGH